MINQNQSGVNANNLTTSSNDNLLDATSPSSETKPKRKFITKTSLLALLLIVTAGTIVGVIVITIPKNNPPTTNISTSPPNKSAIPPTPMPTISPSPTPSSPTPKYTPSPTIKDLNNVPLPNNQQLTTNQTPWVETAHTYPNGIFVYPTYEYASASGRLWTSTTTTPRNYSSQPNSEFEELSGLISELASNNWTQSAYTQFFHLQAFSADGPFGSSLGVVGIGETNNVRVVIWGHHRPCSLEPISIECPIELTYFVSNIMPLSAVTNPEDTKATQ